MEERYDPSSIEAKWRARWKEAGLFEGRIEEGKDPFMITVAWPYPSGAMHVGHARTYTIPDIISRFKRKKGFRVLFPMGWHLTGSPIIGACQRIKNRDEDYIKILSELYGVRPEDLDRMTEPRAFAKYFTNESDLGYQKGMDALGYSIDWTRECTSIDPHFSKMVEWHYRILHSRGLLVKGSHPVKYCPAEENSVVDHDLLAGEGVDIQEFTLVKYRMGDIVLPAATLRPETIWGAVNLWLHPNEDYVEAENAGETWIVSRDAVGRLMHQGKHLTVKRTFKGRELIGRMVKVPVSGQDVPILPATFVDVMHTSGVVGSVPAHAPFDLIALRDLKADPLTLEEYGLDPGMVRAIEPIPIIAVEGETDMAQRLMEELGVRGQDDKEKLDEATGIVYKKEHAKGRMTVGEFAGMPVSKAKEDVKRALLDRGDGDIMFEFSTKPVICRCNNPCVVKLVEDQWFLKYSDPDWKELVRESLRTMDLIPAETLTYYLNVVDWLREWPCTRKTGLGTRLPIDKEWVIESLSDSTIYMAYYTISHIIRQIPVDKLGDEVFDLIYLGKGDAGGVAAATGIGRDVLERMRAEFEFWYPQDYRVSANELIPNHLTFMVFHHVAVLPGKVPKGIIAPGMGILEGKKMSSSKGNIYPVHSATTEFGADVTRLYLMYMSEIWQDFDWRGAQAGATRKHVERYMRTVTDIRSMTDGGVHRLDKWLMSRLHRHIGNTDAALNRFHMRRALQAAFYDLGQDVRRYISRGGSNKAVLKEVADAWINLLSPFIPHLADELWERAGNPGFASTAPFPEQDLSKVDDVAELQEQYIDDVLGDVLQIIKVTKMQPKKVILLTSPEWKRTVMARAMGLGEGVDMKVLMADVLKDEDVKAHSKQVPKFAQSLIRDIRGGKIPGTLLDEYDILQAGLSFLKDQLGCDVSIFRADDSVVDDTQNKRDKAIPGKPAILIE